MRDGCAARSHRVVRPRFLALAALLCAVSSLSRAEPVLDGVAVAPAAADGKRPFEVSGWAVASCPALTVTVSVDGVPFIAGNPFLRSPEIRARFPRLPGADYAGFSVSLDPSAYLAGSHRVLVAADAPGCGRRVLLDAPFFARDPTPAWIAVPVLALALLALPCLLGFLASRLPAGTCRIAQLPAIALGVGGLSMAAILIGPRIFAAPVALRPGAFAALANWDGGWYLEIARLGYALERPAAYAFFPLYPALLRALASLPVPLPLAGSILNAGLFLLAIRQLRALYPESDHAALLFATTPAAFFFFATYTEAAFLFLSVSFFLYASGRKPGAAFAAGLPAALTKTIGFALALAALDEARRRRWRSAVLLALGPLLGISAWCLVLARTTGDPLRFVHVQSAFGRATVPHPGRLLDAAAASLGTGGVVAWWNLAALLLVLTGAAGLLFAGRHAEALYSAAAVLLPLATLRLTSMNRYALAAFPALVFLFVRVRPRWAWALALLQLAGLVAAALQFGRQDFVG